MMLMFKVRLKTWYFFSVQSREHGRRLIQNICQKFMLRIRVRRLNGYVQGWCFSVLSQGNTGDAWQRTVVRSFCWESASGDWMMVMFKVILKTWCFFQRSVKGARKTLNKEHSSEVSVENPQCVSQPGWHFAQDEIVFNFSFNNT